MTVYVSTEVVKTELAKLAKNLKARRGLPEGLTDLAIDLELSLANFAIISGVELGVMPMTSTLAALDAMIAKSKAGK